MNASMQRQAADFLNQQNRRQNWQRIVLVLAAVVVFVTTYMLILPALTLERTPRCSAAGPELFSGDAGHPPAHGGLPG